MWARPERIEFTEYAEMRMRQRDITGEEVIEAMNCPCNHNERDDGRWEIRHPFAGRVLLVIYRRAFAARHVINAMWETAKR